MDVDAPAALAVEAERDDRPNVDIEEILHGARAGVLRMRPCRLRTSSLADFELQEKDADLGQLVEPADDLDGMNGRLCRDHFSPFLVATAGAKDVR